MAKAREFLFACVGKPSSGKSSFLNAITDANAKVGSYPFTTIDPNRGVTFYRVDCPCKSFGVSNDCKPRYGKCVNGTRMIPVQVLDVAGLVPGAHEGKGLGNRFLDDLRAASVLLHIVDASGTTDEKGQNTEGYNPTQDVQWLQTEIEMWIYNNLKDKWTSIVKKHTHTKSPLLNTLHKQLSGYSTQKYIVQQVLDNLKLDENSAQIENWDDKMIGTFVTNFVRVRFPTVLALNKIDMKDSAKNIEKICELHGEDNVVLTSALGENILQWGKKKKYIYYNEGGEDFKVLGDELSEEDKKMYNTDEPLEEIPEKLREKFERIRDVVLFRYGSTGCNDAVKKVVNLHGYFPVYLVKSMTTFTAVDSVTKDDGVFRDCVLAPHGLSIRKIAKLFHLGGKVLFAHGIEGIQLSPDVLVTEKNNILKITTSEAQKQVLDNQ